MVTTEIKKRTFEAEKYPAGSSERIQLNLDQLTSEYRHGTKYVAFIHLPANKTSYAVTHNRGFATKKECEQWIIDNAARYERNHSLPLRQFILENMD